MLLLLGLLGLGLGLGRGRWLGGSKLQGTISHLVFILVHPWIHGNVRNSIYQEVRGKTETAERASRKSVLRVSVDLRKLQPVLLELELEHPSWVLRCYSRWKSQTVALAGRLAALLV